MITGCQEDKGKRIYQFNKLDLNFKIKLSKIIIINNHFEKNQIYSEKI